MASLIEGYNYDIFISYRQKDNKHDGWVSRFVENLRESWKPLLKKIYQFTSMKILMTDSKRHMMLTRALRVN
jgi:hypothetical protein